VIPPVAPAVPAQRELHGQTWTDEYAWMSDHDNPDLAAYLSAERGYYDSAVGHLAHLSNKVFGEVEHRILPTDESVSWKRGDFFYYTRTVTGSEYEQFMSTRDPSVAGRVVLIGNAAQALHPVAGQGFNLGLRDAATLAEMLAGAATAPDFDELLARFAAWRAEDRRGVTRFTDGLVKLFGSELPGVGLVRNFGLLLFNLSPSAKRALSRVSWGFAGRMPRLARGLPLE